MEAMRLPSLTINEAVNKTKRSSSTIRRVIRSITDPPSHPDRSGVEPTPRAVEAFKKKGENFTWKIREDILLKNLSSAQREEEKPATNSSSKMEKGILHILRHELDLKNRQIEKQWDVIQSLNDRLREGNILMGSLQQRLALPQVDSPPPVTVDAPSMEASIILQEASKKKAMQVKKMVSKKASMEASRRTPKKGMLSWLFR